VYNETQGDSFVWGVDGPTFTLDPSLPNYSYKATITSIPGNPDPSENTSLIQVTIGNGVTSIGDSAFVYCTNLTSVTIPNSVTSIGIGAFALCVGLISVTVDANNANYSSLDDVVFNKDKTTLVLFPGGKGGSYTIPNSVTSIGIGAFGYCANLTSVTIPNSVTSIGDVAFIGCENLTSVVIGSSVTSIGSNAFIGCANLTSIAIPISVTSIGPNAFRDSSLITVTIADGQPISGITFHSPINNVTFFGATVDTLSP
jgi:hypothetical protein